MSDLTINCPNCNQPFELTETLAGPAIAEMRQSVLQESKDREDAFNERETKLTIREADLTKQQATLEAELEIRLTKERKKLKATAEEVAQADVMVQLEDLRKSLTEENDKRKKAESAELELRKESKNLQEERDRWELEKQRTLAAERDKVLADARRLVEDEFKLQLKEREKTISDMEAKLKEAQKKATQGSQQLQGEVLEQDLEAALQRKFPLDNIVEVKTGQRGADIQQDVFGIPGVRAGTLLWEAKRAENWSSSWVTKVKQDAREAKAEIAVIVSTVMPKGITVFGEVDGVWVCEPSFATTLAAVLRHGLIEASDARRSSEGVATKATRLYNYMMSPEFRSWLEGIAEPFKQMQEDLDSEMRTIKSRWKKRQKQIERVMDSVAGLNGDLQALAGGEMPELPHFELEVAEE